MFKLLILVVVASFLSSCETKAAGKKARNNMADCSTSDLEAINSVIKKSTCNFKWVENVDEFRIPQNFIEGICEASDCQNCDNDSQKKCVQFYRNMEVWKKCSPETKKKTNKKKNAKGGRKNQDGGSDCSTNHVPGYAKETIRVRYGCYCIADDLPKSANIRNNVEFTKNNSPKKSKN